LLGLGSKKVTAQEAPKTAKESLQLVQMAAAVAACTAAARKSGQDTGLAAGLGEATHFELAVKTLPPVDERVLAGELRRQIVSAADKTFTKRTVVLSESSILIGTSSDELLYEVPLLEISEVKKKGENQDAAAKTTSPSAGKFHRLESWSSRVASGLVDLVNNEPSHYFIIHTKLDGSESGRCVFLL